MVNMMWATSLLILISVTSSLAEDCRQKRRDTCFKPDALGAYPETEEDLLKTCQNVKRINNCILDVKENCENDPDVHDDVPYDEIRTAVEYLDSTCDKDNPTFKAISDNLECMKPVIEKTAPRPCLRSISEKGVDDIIELGKSVILEEDEYSDDTRCLYALADIKCRSLTLGHFCGDDVKHAVKEILIHISTHETSKCTPEILEKLESVFQTYEEIFLANINENILD